MRSTGLVRIALVLGALVFLSYCSLVPDMPDFSLELEANEAYGLPQDINIKSRFTLEEEKYRCRYELSSLDGELLSSGVLSLPAGEWNEHHFDLSSRGEGKYQFELVVQTLRKEDYVDLSFMDKSVDFWVDTTAPPNPDIVVRGSTNPATYQWNAPIPVSLSYPTPPGGSAVSFAYTLNGDNPVSSGTPYAGQITVPMDQTGRTLKAAGVDAAGNWSGVTQTSFSFLSVQSLDPPSATGMSQIVMMYGFGFTDSGATATVADDDGTQANVFVVDVLDSTTVRIGVDLVVGSPGSGGDGILQAGPAWITLTNHTPNEVSVTVPFTITQ